MPPETKITPRIDQGLTSRKRIALHVRDASLLLALALCTLSMDNDLAPMRLWLAMPLAYISGVLTLFLPGRPILRWRHHLWLGLLILAPATRGMLSLRGPLPAAGMREIEGLMSIAMAASALWLLAAARPDRAFGVWTIALVIGAFASALIAPKGQVLTDPAFLITALGAFMGAIGWLRLTAFRKWLTWSGGMRVSGRRTIRIRREEFLGAAGRLWLRAFSLAIGCVIGWRLVQLQQPAAIERALQMAEGLRQQEILWTHSMLFGWGHGTLEQLMEAFAQPKAIEPSPWGGVSYLLATGGLVGFGLLMIMLIYMMLWPRGRWGIETEPLAPAAAHWGVMPLLMTGGMLLSGGPRSEIVVLAIAGWLALALVKARIDPGRPEGGLPVSHVAGGTVLALTAAVLIVSLARPAWGSSILIRTSMAAMSPEDYRARLERAAELNRHEPAIRKALAQSWRQTMTATPGWRESYYLNVVRLYQEAAALDPYDVSIPMELAEFLRRAERPAFETLEDALNRMPKNPVLIKRILFEAELEKEPDLAYQMLRRGMMVEPDDPWWWLQDARSALELGQLPKAQRSLDIALTGAFSLDPDLWPEYVRAAWNAGRTVKPALPPAG